MRMRRSSSDIHTLMIVSALHTVMSSCQDTKMMMMSADDDDDDEHDDHSEHGDHDHAHAAAAASGAC